MRQADYIFAHQHEGFSGLIGFHIQSVAQGQSTLALTVEQKHLNPMGTLHGGVMLAMADTAGGCACSWEETVHVTVEGKLNFLLPAYVGDTIQATAQELRHGASLMVCRIDLHNHRGQLIATGLYTYANTHKKQSL